MFCNANVYDNKLHRLRKCRKIAKYGNHCFLHKKNNININNNTRIIDIISNNINTRIDNDNNINDNNINNNINTHIDNDDNINDLLRPALG